MKKIKIAFFADTLRENMDGAVRTMYQIINRIPHDQFEFLFIVGEKPQRQLNFKVIEIPSLRIPFNSDYKIAIHSFWQKRLDNELNAFRPDIIHVASPSLLGRYAIGYSEKHDIPVSSIYHTHFVSYVDFYLEKLPFLIKGSKKLVVSLMQSFYNRCDLIYVPSQAMINELSDMGILSSKMTLWQRGLDNEMFSISKKQNSYWDQHIPDDKIKILFASRLVWEKNLKTLIDIYKLSMQQALPYQFIIAGEGYAKEKLQKEMPEALFLGELDHRALSQVYANSDYFLFPSISETYGNVVVEAMASGLPCIIAKGGGTNDFIENNKSGIICSPYKAQEFISAIQQLTLDENKRNRIIQNAQDYAQSMSWDSLVNRYFENMISLSNQKYILSA